MQKHRISLNAIRAFTIVARTESLLAAGAELGVTAGAVSLQLKKLERELGINLFHRGNNFLKLTELGRMYFQEIEPAIYLIQKSTDALYRKETEIDVQSSTSLALRWLIPSLDRFSALYPDRRVRVETGSGGRFKQDADVSICYFRADVSEKNWRLLLPDERKPVVSPKLMATIGERDRRLIFDLPILQCTPDNWDWAVWCEKSKIPLQKLNFVHEFDTDDAALHACVAGLGVLLASPFLTEREIRSGSLILLPDYQPVLAGAYYYRYRSESRAAKTFCRWMEHEVEMAIQRQI